MFVYVHVFRMILTYYIDRDCLSPMSICVSQLYMCVSSECMDPDTLTRSIVGFPDQLIPLIASRVRLAFTLILVPVRSLLDLCLSVDALKRTGNAK